MTRLGHMSASEYRTLISDIKPGSKYGNVKSVVDGITFASRLEADRYCDLKRLMQAGEIQGFGIQPSFVIGQGIRYVADFIVCGRDGHIWIEDTKGMQTATFKLKAKLMNERYPWLELRLIR